MINPCSAFFLFIIDLLSIGQFQCGDKNHAGKFSHIAELAKLAATDERIAKAEAAANGRTREAKGLTN